MHHPVALVTGAGSGIGRAIALTLARHGFRLALAGRNPQRLDETARLAHAPDARSFPADLSDQPACRALVARTLDAFGRIDALVNNAACAPFAPIPDHADHDIARAFATNAVAPATLIAAAWPAFARQNHARIVNISSMAAHDPFPGLYAYAASKAAVESLVRSVRNEAGDLDIKAFAIAPGAVETDMLRSIAPADQLPPERCLSPQAVADVVAQCVLGRRDHDHGSVILLPNR